MRGQNFAKADFLHQIRLRRCAAAECDVDALRRGRAGAREEDPAVSAPQEVRDQRAEEDPRGHVVRVVAVVAHARRTDVDTEEKCADADRVECGAARADRALGEQREERAVRDCVRGVRRRPRDVLLVGAARCARRVGRVEPADGVGVRARAADEAFEERAEGAGDADADEAEPQRGEEVEWAECAREEAGEREEREECARGGGEERALEGAVGERLRRGARVHQGRIVRRCEERVYGCALGGALKEQRDEREREVRRVDEAERTHQGCGESGHRSGRVGRYQKAEEF